MKHVQLRDGERVPALGQGTWDMGVHARKRPDEVAAIRAGIDLGMTLIDTAEMYADGAAESVVGEAIAGRRDEVFLVSKVLPRNATRRGVADACARSLERLGTDRLDLYLLHWIEQVPLEDTVAGLRDLQQAGRIRHWGVSNLDRSEMETLWQLDGGRDVQTNQLLYNLGERGIEWDLLPWLRANGIPVMAYSPFDQARLLRRRGLRTFAERHGMTPAQAALAWLLSHGDVIPIPKSSHPARVAENRAAADIELTGGQRAELDELFPPPTQHTPLQML